MVGQGELCAWQMRRRHELGTPRVASERGRLGEGARDWLAGALNQRPVLAPSGPEAP